MTRFIYTLLLYLLLPYVLLRLLWRARRQRGYLGHVGERFGYGAEGASGPLIWIHAVSVGETRAADLVADLLAHGVAAEMRIVYRAVPLDFPMMLAAALEAGDVDAVMHFSRRSAELFVAGARTAGVADAASDVRHLCLSAQVAEPLAGMSRIDIATRPNEVALIALLQT